MKKITIKDPESKSENLIRENIEQLKQIFPEVIKEGKVDLEALNDLLGNYADTPEERFALNWKGKANARREAQKMSTGTLRPCPEESVDWENTQNLYIEGDNLEVLKLLQKSYHNKVKMIYIDPPYNTGNDFVYKDNYKDNLKNYLEQTGQDKKLSTNTESDGRYHSNWLNMMYPRLKLARNLLKDDGVIFISIDDNEVHNLRKIGDEIFGENCFVAAITIITGANQAGEGVNIQKNTETCLVYCKSLNDFKINRVDRANASFRNLNDAPTSLETRKDMGYSVYYNSNTGDFIPVIDYDKKNIHKNTLEDVYQDEVDLIDKGYVPLRPGIRNGKLHRWRWGFDTFKERKNEIVIEKYKDSFKVGFIQDGYNPPKNYMNFGVGTSEVKSLFNGNNYFDYPKSVKFLTYLTKIGTTNNAGVVLDFFSGSATIAHATMQLNAEDGGKRKYICVQLPEQTPEDSIAHKNKYLTIAQIGKERIRRAGKKILEELRSTEDNLFDKEKPKLDIGFKVFKLDSSNLNAWDIDPDNLEHALQSSMFNIKEGRTEDDLLYEILLKYGISLDEKINTHIVEGKKIYEMGAGSLIICLDDIITVPVADGIVNIFNKAKPEGEDLECRVIFKDAGFNGSDEIKTNVELILKQHGITNIASI